jgi:ankyrin repeat protein
MAQNGCTALHYAAALGLPGISSVLINAGIDVDATNDDGLTALDLARQVDHTNVLAIFDQMFQEQVI